MLAPYIDEPLRSLKAESVARHFAGGDVCVATFLDDEFVAHSWVRYQPVPATRGEWVSFGPGHRYTVWGYTHPDFRGRHIRGSFGALDELDRKHQATHSIAYIDTHNFDSLQAEARHGGQRIGLAGYVRIFGVFIPFRSPGAKKRGFGFHYKG